METPSTYVVIWEFHCKVGMEAEFERHYQPGGTWCHLFMLGHGYIRTTLIKDAVVPNRYVTVDYWLSQSHYDDFREKHRARYEDIDRTLETITEAEHLVGAFFTVGSQEG